MSPPKPVEEIDFPDLSDHILALLYAVWAFIRDLCLVLWSYLAGAFWAVWTWPPFETFRFEFSAAVVALWDYVAVHPVTATAIAVLAFVALSSVLNILRVCLLYGSGQAQRRALRDSYGPYYQSTNYGGNRRRSSVISRPRSRGTKSGDRYVGAGSSSWA